MGNPRTIIPVPTYALDDDALLELHNRIHEIDEEADEPCERAARCVVAIRQELEWRKRPFGLNSDGTIERR